MEVKFRETIMYGATGRNGSAHFSGLGVTKMNKTVRLVAISSTGKELNSDMYISADDCGAVARAIAEVAVEANPETRQIVAEQLRAALVVLETGMTEELDDDVSSFRGVRR